MVSICKNCQIDNPPVGLMYYCAKNGNVDILKLLYENGAKMMTVDEFLTLIEFAIMEQQNSMISNLYFLINGLDMLNPKLYERWGNPIKLILQKICKNEHYWHRELQILKFFLTLSQMTINNYEINQREWTLDLIISSFRHHIPVSLECRVDFTKILIDAGGRFRSKLNDGLFIHDFLAVMKGLKKFEDNYTDYPTKVMASFEDLKYNPNDFLNDVQMEKNLMELKKFMPKKPSRMVSS